jgi:CHAT domain-containing protein
MSHWLIYKRTDRLGPHAPNTFLVLLLAFVLSSSCSPVRDLKVKTGDPEASFASIRFESQRGNFSRARAEAQRCYDAWQSRPETKWHWKFKLLDAEMLLLNGETRQASALLREVPPAEYAELEPRFVMLQGYVAFREGRDADALALLTRSAKAAHLRSDYELEADCQLLIAAYAPPEHAAEAERVIGGILELGKAHNLRYQMAAALLNLGVLRIHQSKFAVAISDFEQSGQAAKQSGATLLYSMSVGNLASCYYNLGDFDKAMELRKQAIAIQEPAGLTTPLRDSYLELGSSQLLQGQTREAIESMRRALALASEEDTPGTYSLIASNLASALETIGALDEAELYTERAIAANKGRDPDARIALLLDQAAIAEHRGQHETALRTYQTALAASKGNPSVEWSANAAIASIYAGRNDSESSILARRYFESALRTIEASRAEQLQSKYKITFLSRLIHFYQEYVEFLLRQGDSAEALLVADSSRASVLTNDIIGLNARQNRGLISRIQNVARRTKATFLFYFLAPTHSCLWVITQHELRTVPLPSEEEIGDLIRSYRHLIEEEKTDTLGSKSSLPVRLFQSLVAPALPWVTPNGAVVIVPDGALHGLNFETLVVASPTPHYWIQDVTISIAPSLNILTLKPGHKKTGDPSLLIIGDPQPASVEFSRLPNARAEIDQVRGHFRGTQTRVLRGPDAVPAAYRASQPQRFSTVHIAAHAEANRRSPLDSAIILSPQADGYRLYAREIMEVPIAADLVTLSACRSAGASTLSGEGPVGFAWAFFQAGADNVVASLWDVNDRSTADMMSDFYSEIGAGHSYPAALRQAKLKMLQTNYRRPYYWAPFQLYSRRLQSTQ